MRGVAARASATGRLDRASIDRARLAAGLLGANLLLAVALVRGPSPAALLLGALPVALIAFAALVASDRSILAWGALALPLSFRPVNTPLTSGSPQLFAADLLVVLAVGAWAVARLTRGRERSAERHFGTPLLGWPFVAFAVAVAIATERGHALYGANPFGQPLKLVLYAGIGFALCDLDARKAWRGITAVLYIGVVYNFLDGLYLLGTGGSQTSATAVLSTGGDRVVSLAASLHLAGALFAALLNIEGSQPGRRWGRGLHLSMAALALVGIVLAYGRGTFVAVALGLPVLLAFTPRTRKSLLAVAPLALPIVTAVAVVVAEVKPSIWHTLVDRLNVTAVASSGGDASADWRRAATHEVLQQFHSSPWVGVGFGKGAHFTLNNASFEISQDPHDSYIWLLAAGGVVLLALFAVLVALFFRDLARRLQGALPGVERNLLAWCGLSMVALLVNVALGPMLTDANELLGFWLLALLPAVVPRRAPRSR